MKCEYYWDDGIGHGHCMGTKDCELCLADGDRSKCTIYPEEKLTTADMWKEAQTNNKIYRAGDMAYSKKYGFTEANDFHAHWGTDSFTSIDDIMDIDEWVEMNNVMTKQEAEDKFNIKIVG